MAQTQQDVPDSAAAAAPPAPLPAGVRDDRRGRPVEAVGSYWSRKERQRRATVFQRRAAGATVAQIVAETGLDEHQVHEVLLSDRRSRR